MQVTIGGEPRQLGGFSAFKAFKVMDVIARAESIYRQVLSGAADFKREFEASNVVEFDRAEARREFRPKVLYRTIREEQEDGTFLERDEPVLDDGGQPMLGPDPLAHLSEADWAASDHTLRIGDSPSEETIYAAMIPRAFKMGRAEVLQILALVTTTNDDLEKWDAEGDVDAELDRAAKALLHKAKADELMRLAAASLRLCQEQIRGPFDELVAEIRTTFRKTSPEEALETTEDEEVSASSAAPEPMHVETPTSPTSSTESPGATAGSPGSSSTEPASVS